MSGTVYTTLVKGAAGAILGASTVRSWAAPLIGALTGATLITHPNPHQILIASAACRSISKMLERYVGDQPIVNMILALSSISLINYELAQNLGPIVDLTIVGIYFPSLIDLLARHHLGQAVLIGTSLLAVILATTRSKNEGYEDLVVLGGRIESFPNLYETHPALFTNAVKEFTALLFQAPIQEICLFVEDGRGKIGLIDLGPPYFSTKKIPSIPLKWFYWVLSFSIKSPEQMNRLRPAHEIFWEENCKQFCASAIHLFPLHFEEILSTADKFTPISNALRNKCCKIAHQDEHTSIKFF